MICNIFVYGTNENKQFVCYNLIMPVISNNDPDVVDVDLEDANTHTPSGTESEQKEDDAGDDGDHDEEDPEEGLIPIPGRKYTFKNVDDHYFNMFIDDAQNNSMMCDVLALYSRGQKILYTEAKTFCEQRLTALMLPSIFLTICSGILAVSLQTYEYGEIVVSGVNGITAFLLAVVNYLKLDARAESHRGSAYRFDKLQTFLEFSSGKMMFVTEEHKRLGKIIDETETTIRDIKETNQFVLPEHIRKSFPRLTSINVFSEIKRFLIEEQLIVKDARDLINKIVDLPEGHASREELSKQLAKKETEILKCKNSLSEINTNISKELKIYFSQHKNQIGCMKV